MTLLIAGYTFDREIDFSSFRFHSIDHDMDTSIASVNETLEQPSRFENEPNGIFVVADSAISSNGKTLLNGFRKTYAITVKLWEPFFSQDDFRGYKNVYHDWEIIIGFAGSTLTAQHYLNGLTEHLSKLRISCKPTSFNTRIKYTVLMDCDKSNPLYADKTSWGEDTFTKNDFADLLTAEYISEVIHHSLNATMKSAKKYKHDKSGFDTLRTPFVAGIQCPKSKAYFLYEYKMSPEFEHGIWTMKIEKNYIPYERIAVLGLSDEFSIKAQEAYTKALSMANATEDAMFDFLNAAIDTVNARQEKTIARPSVLKVINNFQVTLDKISN